MSFSTKYEEIIDKINMIDPIEYGRTRNYLNGAVTKLSPYISRGVISTKQVAQIVLAKGFDPTEIESFLKELAWRDYFQRVWVALGDDINNDIKQTQPDYRHTSMCNAVATANTGIKAIDSGINALKTSGYMHNHLRMYVASIACNIGKSHWQMPAKWLYYYLLDADWASNALSWQWVAGSFSSKKYYANQENINKYCHTNQSNTFLDVPYEKIEKISTPEVLKNTAPIALRTVLPEKKALDLNKELPTYIYNFYNLDCKWKQEMNANRILLLEPSFFEKYPVCEKTIEFVLALSKNIPNIQVYVGEFGELYSEIGNSAIHYKEHPTARHYKGAQHKREWIFEEVHDYYPSFFAYWKKCEKYIQT
ncbi:MAG: deoxyribodipyrimidine photolyase [Cytophagales bacterium]|nr:MAG: deoxyribodipyrimidine photolyase [Cytophagales bacterium]